MDDMNPALRDDLEQALLEADFAVATDLNEQLQRYTTGEAEYFLTMKPEPAYEVRWTDRIGIEHQSVGRTLVEALRAALVEAEKG
jgi:hypothetical protein